MLRLAGLLALTLTALLVFAAQAIALPPSFGAEGHGAGQFLEPRGIAVEQESGDVYVADTENNRIDKFGPEGEFILAFGFGVADGSTEALQTCTTTCFPGLPGVGPGQFERPEGIAVDNSAGAFHGDLYVLDRSNHRIEKFGAAGEFLLAFGEEGPGPGQFQFLNGRSVAVGPAGNVYVADLERVQRFSPAGAPETEFAVPGAGFINNLAVDSAGDIYVGSELPGVNKYDPTGTELGSPRAEVGFSESHNVSVGPSGELFVNVQLQGAAGLHHVLTFDSAGAQTASFDTGPEESSGNAIAYSTHSGVLYVLNRSKVRIVTPPPPGPFVIPGSESATETFTTSVTLGATVNPEGGVETKCRFQYVDKASFETEGGFAAPSTEETTPIELTGGEFEDQPASSPISALQPSTTYHYRVLCENAAAETATGPDQQLTTLPPVSIDSTSATGVAATSATLEAELNPHGVLTTYRFEYDTSLYSEGGPAHGTSTPTGSAGSGTFDVTRSAQVQGLQPLTTYHYRVVAENSLGTSFGPDRTFTTQGAAATLLPDDRAWELVSPPNKHGAPLQPITRGGGLIEAAAAGGALAYVAIGPLGEESRSSRSPEAAQLLSRRDSAGGWSTQDISTPNEEIVLAHIEEESEYQLFSDDLSTSLVEPRGATPLSSQTTERTPYTRETDGEFVPLVTSANVPPGTKFGGSLGSNGHWGFGVTFVSASPDANHVLLSSQHLLAAGFEGGFVPEAEGVPSLYEESGGELTLVSVLPDGKPTQEEGVAAIPGGAAANNLRGAISSDGSRVFFAARGQLLMRDVALSKTLQLDKAQPEASGESRGGAFQAASSDGSRVFFTDEERLTVDATATPGAPDLYMCEIAVSAGEPTCTLSDLSVDPNPGESANVLHGGSELLSLNASGGQVYFEAAGALTNAPNAQGEHALPGARNLYEYDVTARQIHLVAVLSSEDEGNSGEGVLGKLTARSSPDGRWFAFMSLRSLTGYDNRDARSGQPDAEVYLFDASRDSLRCVSCNPSGARPQGVFDPPVGPLPTLVVDRPSAWPDRWLAGSVPGWTPVGTEMSHYQSRYLSDSGRIFFNSSDALVPQDTNGVMDVYEYEPPGVGDCTEASPTYSSPSGGCVSLISSGTSAEESAFLDASETGNDVFFLTQSRLTPKDTDGAFDVYDASVGGGEPQVVNPPACEGDACQQPATPPDHPTPGTAVLNGPGNLFECPKGKVKKSGKCVQKKAKKHKKNGKHHKKTHKKKGSGKKQKRANSKRGGQK